MGYFFEFSYLKRFIEEINEYKEVPCSIFESICWLVTGIGCLILYTLGKIYCSISQYWTGYYESWPINTIVVYFYIWLTLHRFFYYFAFCNTTRVVIASGFGYNGMDKATVLPRWDKMLLVRLKDVEMAKFPMIVLQNWNNSTHLWLKYYISARLTEPSKLATFWHNLITYMVSAFWRGFYPVYYITFLIGMLIVEVVKDLYKARKLMFYRLIPSSMLRHFFANIFSIVCLNYIGNIFSALTYENADKLMSHTYFFVPIGVVTTLAVTRFTNLPKKA